MLGGQQDERMPRGTRPRTPAVLRLLPSRRIFDPASLPTPFHIIPIRPPRPVHPGLAINPRIGNTLRSLGVEGITAVTVSEKIVKYDKRVIKEKSMERNLFAFVYQLSTGTDSFVIEHYTKLGSANADEDHFSFIFMESSLMWTNVN